MTEDEVKAVVREATLTTLEDQSATVAQGNAVLRYGTAERRKALEFCADAIAARVAAQLAGLVELSEEERAGLQSVRDEIANEWNVEIEDGQRDSPQWAAIRRGFATLDRLLGGK